MNVLLDKRIVISLLYGIIVPVIGAFLCVHFLGNSKFILEPFHSAIESVGAFISLTVVLILFQIKKYWKEENSRIEWIMCTLIAMGSIDLAHSFVYDGNNNFAWFHSLATFIGGICFVCIWIPLKKNYNLYLYAVAVAVTIITIFLPFPNLAPDLLDGDVFKPLSKVLNFFGGIGFLTGSLYFLRQYSNARSDYSFLLACHGLLFGTASILFEFSRLWDSLWWWWHILRLVGFIVILLYFYGVLKWIGKELSDSKKEAVRSSNAKSQFLSTVSHELRTPMNTIIGLSDLVLESDLNAEHKKNMQIIQKSGEALLSIINNVLEVSKIEAGSYMVEKVEFDLDQLIQDIKEIQSKNAEEKGIEFIVNHERSIERKMIIGDKYKIQQILVNLVSNAIKFTQQGSVTIKITEQIISNTNKKDIEVLFEIIDTGIGISQHKVNKLFDRFYQEDARITREYGGTGLGLSISQEFAKLLNSEIKIESELGKGSNFHFKIIFQLGTDVKKPKIKQPKLKEFKLKKPTKVLIVDDFQYNLVIIKYYLQNKMITLIDCENGAEALNLFENDKFDIVIMDIQMPVMDGLEAAKRIRELEKKQNRKPAILIALSASAFDEDRQKSLEAGYNYHLEKPIRKKELLAFLQNDL